MSFMIKVGSITNAQRAHKLLSQKGYTSRLSRLQNPKPGDGCGYVLKVYNANKYKAVNILEDSGINILGVEDI